MMRSAAAVLALLSSCSPTFAQRAVVCPPNLSYCYEKPILKEKRVIDEYNDIVEEMRQAHIALDRRARASDAGLEYQLERALRLRR